MCTCGAFAQLGSGASVSTEPVLCWDRGSCWLPAGSCSTKMRDAVRRVVQRRSSWEDVVGEATSAGAPTTSRFRNRCQSLWLRLSLALLETPLTPGRRRPWSWRGISLMPGGWRWVACGPFWLWSCCGGERAPECHPHEWWWLQTLCGRELARLQSRLRFQREFFFYVVKFHEILFAFSIWYW